MNQLLVVPLWRLAAAAALTSPVECRSVPAGRLRPLPELFAATIARFAGVNQRQFPSAVPSDNDFVQDGRRK